MTPTLTVTPNPSGPNERPRVDGTGFDKYRTRLKLDGAIAAAPFRPAADGSFHVGVWVSEVGEYTLTAEQYSAKRWTEKAMSRITVLTAAGGGGGGGYTSPPEPPPPPPPPPPPDPSPTGPVRTFPAGTNAANISATVANETWLLDPLTVLTGAIDVRAPGVTIRGGTVWYIHQNADDLTLHGIKGRRVDVWGRKGLHVMGGTDFRGHTETAIRFWVGSAGALWDRVVLEDFSITHTGFPQNGIGYSSISNQRPSSGKAGTVTIRRYKQDQRIYGWGGIEVWDSVLSVTDSWFKGGNDEARGNPGVNAHLSPPRCHAAYIAYNDMDMTSAFWGVEAAELNDLRFENNRAYNGQNAHAIVQIHGGSTMQAYRDIIRYNDISNISAFVNQYGWDHQIVNNRLTNVPTIYRSFGNPGGNVTISNNGPSVVVTAGPR